MRRKWSMLLSSCVLIGILFVIGCASPRQFAIIPSERSLEIETPQTFGTCKYEPSSDERTMMDRTGQGSNGAETQLGDQNYSNPLLPAFDIHMKTTLQKSGIFSELVGPDALDAPFSFKATINQFLVLMDEQSARNTESCVGGMIGSALAANVDVEANTLVTITGSLLENGIEVWNKSVQKQMLTVNDFANTYNNTQDSMAHALGEACKELVEELAGYLNSR
jgi:hypothetical protein